MNYTANSRSKLKKLSQNSSRKRKNQKESINKTHEIEVKKNISYLRHLKNFEKVLLEEKKAFNISDDEIVFITRTIEKEIETHAISSLCYTKFLIVLNRYNCAYKFWDSFENILRKKDSSKLIKIFNENLFEEFYPELKLLKSEEWNVSISQQFLIFYDFIHTTNKELTFSSFFHFYFNETTVLSLEKLKPKDSKSDTLSVTNNPFGLFTLVENSNLIESTIQIPCWNNDKLIIIEIDLMELLIKLVTNTFPYGIETNYMRIFKKVHKLHIRIAHIYLNE